MLSQSYVFGVGTRSSRGTPTTLSKHLPHSFFSRPAEVVAPELIAWLLFKERHIHSVFCIYAIQLYSGSIKLSSHDLSLNAACNSFSDTLLDARLMDSWLLPTLLSDCSLHPMLRPILHLLRPSDNPKLFYVSDSRKMSIELHC